MTVPYYGAFHELRPGEVLPDGWLKDLLQRQASELGRELPRISWPFTWPYWNGETQTQGSESFDVWGPWEQVAYWIDGALRLAILLQDQHLLRESSAPVDFTLSHPRNDDFIGPENFADPQGEYYRWPHAVFFRAVAALSDYRRTVESADALRRHYLADHADYGYPTRNVTNIEAMLWAYERTGDSRLLELAEKAWGDFQHRRANRQDGDGDLAPDAVFANLPIKAHGVSYAEQSKLPAILYLYTGKPEYLTFALAAQERVFTHHMLAGGIPSTSEFYADCTGRDAHETCDIADHLWTWGYELLATGDGIWGDRIERACFNSALGAIRKDWKGVQYFSSPNQVLATGKSNHIGKQEAFRFGYAPNPAMHIACCAGNAHRIFPAYAGRMWMKTREHGLAATLYGPCRLQVELHGQLVDMIEETDYPFSERIDFTLRSAEPVTLPFSLRIPAWCSRPELFINNCAIPLPEKQRGFITLHRTFHPGDIVSLHLPMRIATTHWPDGGVALERGPLVYSLPIEASWHATIASQWSTADYPMWDAIPSTEWNYALAPGKETLENATQFERTPINADPWLHPSVHLRVPAKRIPAWKIIVDETDPEKQFTPPVPQHPQVEGPVTMLTLVPYGATHLRLTVFPVEKSP